MNSKSFDLLEHTLSIMLSMDIEPHEGIYKLHPKEESWQNSVFDKEKVELSVINIVHISTVLLMKETQRFFLNFQLKTKYILERGNSSIFSIWPEQLVLIYYWLIAEEYKYTDYFFKDWFESLKVSWSSQLIWEVILW